MEIRVADTMATKRAPADFYTGIVWHDSIIGTPSLARLRSARVSFQSHARPARRAIPCNNRSLNQRSSPSPLSLQPNETEAPRPGAGHVKP